MKWFMLALFFVCPLIASAQAPPAKDYSQAQKLILGYFDKQVSQIEANCLTNLTTKASWEAQRPERRRQFFEMMGLWPMPERGDLKATITGTVEGEGFVVEKLHFQSLPGLYVTANLYRPKDPPKEKLPAILYVCGHGNVVENGISYGSKVSYQYHPAWFATHGYVCLILDTLQLGEIQGLHHGTYREGMWWWQTRGYTPGGVELWNGIRALDYLESRPEVDKNRLGLTGRSGGGASSWWIAAADERVKAVVPVAGIADLRAHLVKGETERFQNGVIDGHCDCMFLVNKYRWDFADVAALIAPRPLLLGNSDEDAIFPVSGYRRLANKVSQVYELYGEAEKFQLLETKGPHKDTPELRIGINRWMNRWLKGDTTTKVEDDLPPKLTPQQLKVFDEIPIDSVNENVHEIFTREHDLKLPEGDREIRYWWATKQTELKKQLEREVFSGWPKNPPPLSPKLVGEAVAQKVRLQAVEFTSEEGMPLTLFILRPADNAKIESLGYSVVHPEAWNEFYQWGEEFGKVFGSPPAPPPTPSSKNSPNPFRNDSDLKPYSSYLASGISKTYVFILPRGVGPTQWSEPGSSFDIQVKRRFALIGQTLDGQQVWDIRRAMAAAKSFLKIPANAKIEETLTATRSDVSGLALYAAVFEPNLDTVELVGLPATLRLGPTLLNGAKHLDNSYAIALAMSKTSVKAMSVVPDRDWAIPKAIAQATYSKNLRIIGLRTDVYAPSFLRK